MKLRNMFGKKEHVVAEDITIIIEMFGDLDGYYELSKEILNYAYGKDPLARINTSKDFGTIELKTTVSSNIVLRDVTEITNGFKVSRVNWTNVIMISKN